jgi:hypothetical protein
MTQADMTTPLQPLDQQLIPAAWPRPAGPCVACLQRFKKGTLKYKAMLREQTEAVTRRAEGQKSRIFPSV